MRTADQMEPGDLYVVVIHKATGAGFGLDRRYHLKAERLDNPMAYVTAYPKIDEWDGWFPSGSQQFPKWAEPESHTPEAFKAFWIVGPSKL